MKKILFFISSIMLLLFPFYVRALGNTGAFGDLIIPSNDTEGRFFTNNSGTLASRGYSRLEYNGMYYALPATPDYFYGTYGGALSICNIGMIPDNYYSVTYAWVSNDSTDYIYPGYVNYTNKLGYGPNTSYNTFSFNYTTITSAIQLSTIPGLLPIGDYLYTYTFIFKAPTTATCLLSGFTSNSKSLSSTEVAFVGYRYESLGTRPMSESEMTTIINNSNQNVINNINNSINNQTTILRGEINDMEDTLNTSIWDQINQDIENTKQILAGLDESFNYCEEPYNILNMPDASRTNSGVVCSINSQEVDCVGTYLSDGSAQFSLNPNTQLQLENGKTYTFEVFGDLQGGYIGIGVLGSLTANNPRRTLSMTRDRSITLSYNISEKKVYNSHFKINVIEGDEYKPWQKYITEEECKNRIDMTNDKIDETNKQLNDLNNSINNDNVDSNDGLINDMINNSAFNDNTGLSTIINAPLSLLSNLTQTCQPIELTIPWFDADLEIPCMSTSVYSKFNSGFINTIKVVINGFLVYRILVMLYFMVKDFKDPESDRVEVVDL